jgi:hypothetical protein
MYSRLPLQQPGLLFNVTALRSDNPLRLPDVKSPGEIASVGATVDLVRHGTRLDYDLIGDLRYTDYFDPRYPRKLLGYFNGQVLLGIVPQRISWSVQDSINQLTADPFSAPTPGNYTAANYFTTGPRVSLNLGALTRLIVDAEYSRTSTLSQASVPNGFANSSLDSTRYSGTATLQRNLSSSTSVSLTGSAEEVLFDRAAYGNDYHNTDVYVGYSTATPRMRLTATLGYNKIHTFEQDSGAPTASIGIARRISVSSVVAVSVEQRYSDALNLLRYDVAAPTGLPPTYRLAQSEPIRNRSLYAAWTYELGRNSMVLSAGWRREEGKFDPEFNRNIRYASLQYLRRLRPTLSLLTNGVFQYEEYPQRGYRDQEFDAFVSLQYQPAPRCVLAARYEYFDRSSVPATGSFREVRIGLVFVYRVL